VTLTDAQRFWLELKNAGAAGLHSWDCYGWTRNASQRAKDCVTKGQQVYVRTERRNGRPGARYFLEGFQPSDALPVAPNRGSEVGGDGGVASRTTRGVPEATGSVAADLSITPAPPDTTEPVAIVRDFDGSWSEVPVSELQLPWAA